MSLHRSKLCKHLVFLALDLMSDSCRTYRGVRLHPFKSIWGWGAEAGMGSTLFSHRVKEVKT